MVVNFCKLETKNGTAVELSVTNLLLMDFESNYVKFEKSYFPDTSLNQDDIANFTFTKTMR